VPDLEDATSTAASRTIQLRRAAPALSGRHSVLSRMFHSGMIPGILVASVTRDPMPATLSSDCRRALHVAVPPVPLASVP
jgi:hypothetical protein